MYGALHQHLFGSQGSFFEQWFAVQSAWTCFHRYTSCKIIEITKSRLGLWFFKPLVPTSSVVSIRCKCLKQSYGLHSPMITAIGGIKVKASMDSYNSSFLYGISIFLERLLVSPNPTCEVLSP